MIAGYAVRFEKILKDSAAASSEEEVVQPSAENGPTPAGMETPTVIGSHLSSTEQPPITISEVKTTAIDDEGKTEVTASAGDPVDAEPTQVSQNTGIARLLASTGGISAVGTAIWGFVSGHLDAIAVGIVCLTLLILALIFRGAIMDAIRMQTAADPNKYNVK